MTEPQDRELSRIYREAKAPEPPHRIDDAILAASRRAAGSGPRVAGSALVRRSGVPVALAATVLLTFTVTLMVFQDDPEAPMLTPPPAAGARAEKPAQPEASPPKPPPESRRDAKDQPPTESASRERAGARQRDFVPDAPMRSSPQMQPAPSAPAAGASPQAEAPLAPQAVGRTETANRLSVDEAKARSPEKWLEDIRVLKAQGKTHEAERELAQFRKRHPGYRLPEDLR